MLTFEQIKELIDLVSVRKLGELEVERAGFRLKITSQDAAGRPVAQLTEAPAPAAYRDAATTAPRAAQPMEESVAAPESATAGAHILTSPIVGTFYSAPSPEAEPFARPGARVKKGQVLCIVEAMKLMNEIESDVDGVVLAVFPKNAQPVEFGEQLFAIRAD